MFFVGELSEYVWPFLGLAIKGLTGSQVSPLLMKDFEPPLLTKDFRQILEYKILKITIPSLHLAAQI